MDKEAISKIQKAAESSIEQAKSLEELERIRIKVFGRKGELTQILRGLSSLPIEERKEIGRLANLAKEQLTARLAARKVELETSQATTEDKIDVTLPGYRLWRGSRHPITQTLDEILAIFVGMGYQEELGPEIETEWYNYDALNFPPDHPARDMIACFYLGQGLLLRSHTSPVQIRVMERKKPPIRIVAPGRVFRPDAFDASHSPVFYQVEGLYVDEGVSMADLKGTLEVFSKKMFGEKTKIRFSPSYFPFTEPSAELAILCVVCEGQGCKTCKNSGWLEILGCGMVHPKVLENVGYDSVKYTGFAFGMGVERIAMIKYAIDDIRLFYENDLRFLEQF
uniref:Phenylalanine--tRNA ligase alpha subunit n=1 Tax=candidate division WOR-3 bacterium TaxID=2052148 RepID=A0A7C6A7Y3_UNCW3